MTKHSEFQVHILNDNGIKKAKEIAVLFDSLLSELEKEGMCILGREFSLVKTKLEEACFFAKKAMAVNLVNQKQE